MTESITTPPPQAPVAKEPMISTLDVIIFVIGFMAGVMLAQWLTNSQLQNLRLIELSSNRFRK